MSGYREVFKRKEVKYLVNEEQYAGLREFFETMARPDEYGLSRINNIYYDTPDHLLVRRSLEKPLYKEKLRLRTYGETDSGTNAFIEIKKKYDGVVYKRRIPGRYEDLYGYMMNTGPDLPDTQIADEIRAFMNLYKNLVPAMSICYDRIALAGTEDKDFRVTFDSNIEWNAKCSDLRNVMPGEKLLKPGQYLMEIKVMGAVEPALARELSRLKVFPASFSKYGNGYRMMMDELKAAAPSMARVIMIGSRMKGAANYA
ncbi:MAG: polyphosphate polymerase domain-containing protein [Lachnospiraceae bacterium]|nr:polyphosphate polymerase domain-containing protein [Lachnospiraceae bacterium]